MMKRSFRQGAAFSGSWLASAVCCAHRKANFWTVAKGKMVGYIESIGTRGIIFTHKYIDFRPTTSNLSNHGEILNISLEKFFDKNNILAEAMNKRQPVTIDFTTDLIGSPRVGNVGVVFPAIYLNDAMIDDKIVDAVISRKN